MDSCNTLHRKLIRRTALALLTGVVVLPLPTRRRAYADHDGT